VTICEDLWDPMALGRQLYSEDPAAALAGLNVDVIVNMSASPYQVDKLPVKRSLLGRQARRVGKPIVYVNQVGGNDELIFDGASFAVDADGRRIAQCRRFEEDLVIVDLAAPPADAPPEVPDGVAGLKLALELGLRDYVHKCGFSNVVLGLSGGVDSALVAVLAADALGPQNVLALSMPSRYSSEHSKSDAALLAKNLGIRYEVAPIEPMHAAFEAGLATIFAGTTPGLTEENLQARIRGAVVMAISNKFGHLALTTGNKSELSTGYCTLYGDMCGGLAVIGDVPKTSVYALCRYINQAAGGPRIPESILTKPPSAELKPNQTDQDTLPPYDLLDEILTRYVEQEKDVSQIAAAGFDADVVRRIARMVDRSEYKRRQGAPTLKVTGRAFGTGRRLPIAQRYNY
jgi:NAD+ synthase/NAD+ synthase (glutamine-hydrolysing)